MNETTISYSEEKIRLLIDKSLEKMEQLDALSSEMDDSPQIYKLWVECTDKIVSCLERLHKLQNYNKPKDSHNDTQTGNINNLVFINSTELLNKLESTVYGVKKREDLYIDNE